MPKTTIIGVVLKILVKQHFEAVLIQLGAIFMGPTFANSPNENPAT